MSETYKSVAISEIAINILAVLNDVFLEFWNYSIYSFLPALSNRRTQLTTQLIVQEFQVFVRRDNRIYKLL